MAKLSKQLFLTIEQAGKVSQVRLNHEDHFTIGKDPHNDLTIYGDEYPARHTLFEKKNNHYQLRYRKFMNGEVEAGDSRLRFRDLILHNLLPKKDESYFYPLTQDKRGYILAGDAKITFQFVGADPEDPLLAELRNFKGYSWTYVTLKNLARDWQFKAILLLMFALHGLLLNYISQFKVDPTQRLKALDVPERFAKFIVKSPAEMGTEIGRAGSRGTGSEEEESGGEEAAQRNRDDLSKRETRPETQGVLGLLTGIGGSTQSSSLTDLLLDQGLVKELDAVMSSSNLQVGRSSSNGGDIDPDALVGTSPLGGGIDDILKDVNQVESVSLGEKGQIQLDQIGGMRGTGGGLGKRSEESVRGVMMSYTGRLTYIYNKYLKKNPELRGKIVVDVTIAADGSVSSAKVASSTVSDEEFEREILNFVRRWKYPPIDEGTVTVSYPLFFNKVG
ncbi:MAG TPA: AgmX/PglI C-terminal domain-containing protein [bacterium]